MSDMFTINGRRMTRQLADAIDALAASDRKVVVAALTESTGRLAGVHHALALEVQLAGLLHDDALRHLEADVRADIPEPPLPEATGGTCWYDPKTGTVSDTPPDAAA